MKLLPAVLTLVLLAGCLQSPTATHLAPASATPAAAPPDPFHPAASNASSPATLATPKPAAPVFVGRPGAAEPNIVVGFDGALYVSNPGAVWRSADQGKTWQATKSQGIEGGGDGDLAADASGALYYLGLFGKEKRNIPFMVSRDQGETWSPAVDLSAGSGNDREWIDVTPDGKVYGAWRGKTGIEFNASQDHGATWLPKVVKVGEDGDGGPIAHDPVSGALAIPVIDLAGPVGLAPPVVHVYTSTDQGTSWAEHKPSTLPRSSPVEPNGYASDFPVAAFDGAGTLYLVYSAETSRVAGEAAPPEEAALYGIYLQVSHDLGATWTSPQLLSDATKDARFPWIAAGSPGRIAVVWYENVRGVPGEMLPDEWHVKLYESIDEGKKGVVVQLTQQPNHLGSLCTSGTGCLAADRSMLDFFEVAIGLDGQPVVAFSDSALGTGIGLAARTTEIHFGTVTGTSLLG